MKPSSRDLLFASLIGLALAAPSTAAGPEVNESARQIPVAYDVDVVVVGSSTGAVAAAVAAAEAGQRVFLAAERPYLGDDMTASLRLWLAEGEKPTDPLAKAIFDDDHTAHQPDPRRLPFSYQADMESSRPHEDTSPPKILTDGNWGDPVRQTVQYDGDAAVTADLQAVKQVEGVRVVVHHGAGPSPYKVARVTVQTSNDRKTWSKAMVIKIDNWGVSGNCLETTAPVGAKTRYLKFAEDADEGGFADPVGADHSQHFTGMQGETDVLQNKLVFIAGSEVVYLDHGRFFIYFHKGPTRSISVWRGAAPTGRRARRPER